MTLPSFKQIEDLITHSRTRDRFKLHEKLLRLKKNKTPTANTKGITSLKEEAEKSVAFCEARRATLPELTYPDLPVSDRRQEIEDAIRHNQVVVICGETGSGKTTQLPKICMAVGQGVRGVIAHTQPRRIAARAVAERIAEEVKSPLGTKVGFKIRFQDKSHPDTLVKLMTDGILLAEIQSDPYLSNYDTIIIDEAHERTLNIDFLLGYLKWLLPRRPDLKLIITSATIDPERFSSHFSNAPIIEVSGRTYPVEIRYTDDDEESTDEEGEPSTLFDKIYLAVEQLFRENGGDILIFMSGERDIRDLAEFLQRKIGSTTEILPLFSRLSQSEQLRIFKPATRRRIVISTNVAETSLTVPGIHCVIDTGRARISRYSHRSKLQQLPIEKISQASANQRSGRCGRVAAGICIRMYSELDFINRSEFTDPEIIRTNLASVILQMSALGLGEINNFPFIDRPSDKMIRDGFKQLFELQAIDSKRKLTPMGKQLARFPVDPQLGRMLFAASEENCLTELLIIVSALSVQDPRERPMEAAQAADQKHTQFNVDGSDLMAYCLLWEKIAEQRQQLSGNRFKRYCRDNFLSYMRIREWHDVHQQLAQVVGENKKLRLNKTPAKQEAVHRSMISGLLSQIGFRHDQSEYLGARNLKFNIFPGSSLFKVKPKWIFACELVETSRPYARNVGKITPEWVEQAAEHLLNRQHYEPHWEKKQGRAAVYERVTLYGLVLSSGRRIPFENIDPEGARELFIRHALVEQEIHSNAKFFLHNKALIQDISQLEDKGRRVDLGIDEDWLFQFYDERLPEKIVNAVTFQQWLDENPKQHEKLLHLQRNQVLEADEEQLHATEYPDHLTTDGLVIKLEYRFEPGHRDDGVTAIIPFHQLNQVDEAAFMWLVPGLLEEKLVALIKSLPKAIRRNFVPAPDFASRCLDRLDRDGPPLLEQLSSILKEITGVRIERTAWREEILADHLRMNFHLLDDKGKLKASSRQLPKLQQEYSAQANTKFDSLASATLAHTKCQDWSFGQLPKMHQGNHDGKSVTGYPAVIDEGDSVGVRIFDNAKKAAEQHRLGLIRLLNIKLKKDIRYLHKQASNQSAMAYQRLQPAPFETGIKPQENFGEEITDFVLAEVFLHQAETIRDADQLDTRIQKNKTKLTVTHTEASKLLDQILSQAQEVRSLLSEKRLPGSCKKDIKAQLDALVYRGVLLTTPYSAVSNYPRYISAMVMRIEKALQEPAKDALKQAELEMYATPFWQKVENGQEQQPQHQEFRWALEEFRVSLFAQALKTAFPISAKRLKKMWDETYTNT